MQNNSTLILTLVMAAGTILTRFLPFILFPDGKQMPRYVEYLGHVLPYATMGILVVYCLKGVSLFSAPFGIPEFLVTHTAYSKENPYLPGSPYYTAPAA